MRFPWVNGWAWAVLAVIAFLVADGALRAAGGLMALLAGSLWFSIRRGQSINQELLRKLEEKADPKQ